MVGATGVEPARISPKDPKSFASANSATRPDFQSIFAAAGTTVNTFYGARAWNDEVLRVLESFAAGGKDDEVDALSGAYETIGGRGAPFEYRVSTHSPAFQFHIRPHGPAHGKRAPALVMRTGTG